MWAGNSLYSRIFHVLPRFFTTCPYRQHRRSENSLNHATKNKKIFLSPKKVLSCFARQVSWALLELEPKRVKHQNGNPSGQTTRYGRISGPYKIFCLCLGVSVVIILLGIDHTPILRRIHVPIRGTRLEWVLLGNGMGANLLILACCKGWHPRC